MHLAATEKPANDALSSKLQSLLTYGEPAANLDKTANTVQIIVAPRLGTVSPWASKASGSAQNFKVTYLEDFALAEAMLLARA